MTVALLLPNMKVCLRDISQAYTQSTTSLIRDIYILAPAEMNVPEGYLLRVCRPLYGIPEAGTHWFHTYHKYHTTALAMTPSTFDPCLLFTGSSDGFGMVRLQTDDSLRGRFILQQGRDRPEDSKVLGQITRDSDGGPQTQL